jgi:hypothetical protein
MTGLSAANGIAWALAALFLVAASHKARMLARRGPINELLIATSRLGRRAPKAVLAGAMLVELAIATVLIAEPAVGLIAAALLLLAYAAALRGVPAETRCNCFGAGSQTRARFAAKRNLAFCAAALGAAVAADSDGKLVVSHGIGVAAVFLSLVAAMEALQRLPHLHPAAGEAVR